MDPNNPNQNGPTASTRAMPQSSATQPIPSPTTAASTTIPSASPLESARTSRSSSEQEEPGPSHLSTRPTVGQRQPSGSVIVPADHPEIEAKRPISFPPGDARAMSPRRSNEDCNQLVGKARSGAQNWALDAQAGLNALVEKIETVKSSHEKLDRDNNSLQEYIGGLTRSMSKTDLTTRKK